MKTKLGVLVAAAGRGTRAGLPYPKTLYPIQGTPILLRILALLAPLDANPTVVVSPEGHAPIDQCLNDANFPAHLVVQSTPLGMGDAVLCFTKSPACDTADHILLMWGDIPFIQQQTVDAVVHAHFAHNNDFTFATRQVDSAYTIVSRNAAGDVIGVVETREMGIVEQQAGERDIGLFMFRKQIVLDALQQNKPGKWGKHTGEHGFLYIIGVLASQGFQVEALPVATQLDLVSLNRLTDLECSLLPPGEDARQGG